MTTTPCWIISLNPESASATILSQALSAQGVAHEFFPAVDGRKGTPPLQGREHLDVRQSLLRHRRLLNGAEIGCYLAHYRAVGKAWAAGLERICIIEDDVVPEHAFAATLTALEHLPADVEMVRLMALRIRRRKQLSPLPGLDSHHLVRPERGWCGTQGYVLNRRGMEKILERGWNIFEPIDKFYDHFWEYDLRQFGVEPHLLYEIEHPSSIRKTPAPVHIPLLLRLLAPFHKAAFSRSRHRYLKSHADEFYPAEWPAERMGRTKRMK